MDILTNLPDLLGLHFGNPLGLSPLAMLIIIFVLVGIMTFFNHQIRYKDGGRFYPVLYALFAVSLAAVFYYVFQADLPKIGNTACIGWHCRSSLVGGVAWAVVGIVLTSFVSFGLFIATMQIVAQLSVEAGMSLAEKRWKEWKWGQGIVLFGVGNCRKLGDDRHGHAHDDIYHLQSSARHHLLRQVSVGIADRLGVLAGYCRINGTLP